MREDVVIRTTAEREVTVGEHAFGPTIIGYLAVADVGSPDHEAERVSAGLTREECLAIGTALLQMAMGHKEDRV